MKCNYAHKLLSTMPNRKYTVKLLSVAGIIEATHKSDVIRYLGSKSEVTNVALEHAFFCQNGILNVQHLVANIF